MLNTNDPAANAASVTEWRPSVDESSSYRINPAYSTCRQATNHLSRARGAVDELRRLLPGQTSEIAAIYNALCGVEGRLEALLNDIPHRTTDLNQE